MPNVVHWVVPIVRHHPRDWIFEAAMVRIALVVILGSLSIAALVWCFLGFTRALHDPPGLSGLLLHLHQAPRKTSKRQAAVLEFPAIPSDHAAAARITSGKKAGGK